MFELIKRKEYRGAGLHLSGWPWVCEHLKRASTPGAVLLDDFVEDSLDKGLDKRTGPWFGIFHHPPITGPKKYTSMTSPTNYLRRPEIRRVMRSLKGAVALSTQYATWLQEHPAINCPVYMIPHPMKRPDGVFDVQTLEQPEVAVFHYGAYLKNLRAIHQVPPKQGYRYVTVAPGRQWERNWARTCKQLYRRREYAGVLALKRLPAAQLELQLCQSVCFFEFVNMAASNAMLECIMRNTPIIVNRIPPAEEYLGRDYPLFYDHISQVTSLLDRDKLREGHTYLKEKDKSPFYIENFVAAIQKATSADAKL